MSLRLSSRSSRLIVVAAALAACSPAADQPVAPRPAPGTASRSAAPSPPNLVIVELMANPKIVADAAGEYIKLYNPGPAVVDLQNFKIQSASGATVYTGTQNVESHTIANSVVVPVGACVVLGNNVSAAANGGITTEAYSYGTSITLGNNNTEWVTIKTPGGVLLDSVSYSASTIDFSVTPAVRTITTPTYDGGGAPANGASRLVIDPSVDNTIAGGTNWQNATTTFGAGDKGTPNDCQYTWLAPGQQVGPLDHVTLTGPATVSAGATIQLLANPQDANGLTVSTATLSWASSDVTIASVDGAGVVTGVAASLTAATITVTATDNGITKMASQGVTVTVPVIAWIDVSSSSASFPPGFQTQLFATARVSQGGTVVPANFTFEALDPATATVALVANTGIITGVSAGPPKPRIRITAIPVAGGTPYQFTSTPVTIEVPAPAPTSIYATNDEFGDPTAANPANPNDLLIVRPQYTLSYNEARGTPNWVSYELDARQMVAGQDRCNCFTADPLLPPANQIFTSDYTNGGFDRGHMTRSADRTAGNTDNAATFFLTNVVPQTADLNEGVWAQFENALGDSAKAGRAVYIITGPLYSKSHGLSFVKNEGKIAIPDSTWKVALIGPDPGGVPFTRANVQTLSDLAGISVLAVNMPNIAGVRGDPWQMYQTTVAKIETATGYNFLSLLSEAMQCKIEVRNCVPVPKIVPASGSNTVKAGTQFVINTSATDGDGADGPWHLTIDWGDGTSFVSTLYALPTDAHPFARAKSWSAPGTYTVKLTVTDKKGASAVSTLVVTVTP